MEHKMLSKAITIATYYHAGQTDKGGNPYILHPLRVMLKAETIEERIVAVLHDVVEDAGVAFSDLLDEGISKELVLAVDALTRRDGETYMEFIERVKGNLLAAKVKILDIEDNMDLSRIPSPTDEDRNRLKRYEKALKILKGFDPTESA